MAGCGRPSPAFGSAAHGSIPRHCERHCDSRGNSGAESRLKSPMLDPIRQEITARSKTVVVKVGTRVLAHDDGTLDQKRVTAIAEQVVRLMEDKRHVVL